LTNLFLKEISKFNSVTLIKIVVKQVDKVNKVFGLFKLIITHMKLIMKFSKKLSRRKKNKENNAANYNLFKSLSAI